MPATRKLFPGVVAFCAAFVGIFIMTTFSAADDKKSAPKSKRNVAIVLYNQVELLDFAGPGEVFQAAAGGMAFRVYTVAATDKPLVSQGFLSIQPQYTIANCPKPDIVVIPGGNASVLRHNKQMMAWLADAAGGAEITMSVCTGAFALADLGLLDGKEATTHWSGLPSLKREYPKIHVCENRRFVDTGNVITTAGVSAGIDGALHVVARLRGLETARRTAKYMEYRWEPEADTPTKPKTAAAQATD
jgi:transcriptional regulator GlxA family with amidase domain